MSTNTERLSMQPLGWGIGPRCALEPTAISDNTVSGGTLPSGKNSCTATTLAMAASMTTGRITGRP